MSVNVILTCPVSDGDDGAFITRRAVLPIAPFPGLIVGFDTVVRVQVCQGNDNDDIECEMTPVDMASARGRVRSGSWRWL